MNRAEYYRAPGKFICGSAGQSYNRPYPNGVNGYMAIRTQKTPFPPVIHLSEWNLPEFVDGGNRCCAQNTAFPGLS
jgi:hypothetical protein